MSFLAKLGYCGKVYKQLACTVLRDVNVPTTSKNIRIVTRRLTFFKGFAILNKTRRLAKLIPEIGTPSRTESCKLLLDNNFQTTETDNKPGANKDEIAQIKRFQKRGDSSAAAALMKMICGIENAEIRKAAAEALIQIVEEAMDLIPSQLMLLREEITDKTIKDFNRDRHIAQKELEAYVCAANRDWEGLVALGLPAILILEKLVSFSSNEFIKKAAEMTIQRIRGKR